MIIALLVWPGLFAGLLCSAAAVLVRRWTLLLLGALLTLPFFGYLAMTPRFSFVVLVPMALQMGGAIALRPRHRGVAILLSLPTVGMAGYVAAAVFL